MSVPHSIHDVDGAGCHRLIREGATLVTRGEEIMEEIGPIGQLALPLENSSLPTDRLTQDNKKYGMPSLRFSQHLSWRYVQKLDWRQKLFRCL